MGTRQSIGGRSSFTLYLMLILVLALALSLAFIFLVIVPDRQQQREAEVKHMQTTATAEAKASEVQRAFAAGVAFASAGDWSKAADEFAKVVSLDPGYKDAPARLADARAKAEAAKATGTAQSTATAVEGQRLQATATAEARASEVQRAYAASVAFAAAGDWEKAAEEFAQVVALAPDYKDAAKRLAEARNKAETARTTAREAELQRAYDAGAAFVVAGDWERAEEAFARVIALEPRYKDAPARLAGTRAQAETARKATATAKVVETATAGAQARTTTEAQMTATARAQVTPTSLPTRTPEPLTPTPSPTSTPEPPTATRQPTSTSKPPTSTPITPTPTVTDNTPPETTLEVGQSWRQNRVRLKLEDILFAPTRECITLLFNFYNDTGREIVVTIAAESFSLRDNLNREWEMRTLSDGGYWGCGDWSWINTISEVVPAGKRLPVSYDAWAVSFRGFVTDTRVDQVVVTVDGVSQIRDARWRIPIYR